MPTRVAVRDGPSMNPSKTVGALRDPLGFSAWRSVAHQIYVEAGSLFIEYRFKKRLPSVTNLAGRLFVGLMLRNGASIRKRSGQ
jgi:hypothetical protein